jgi:3-deoxy-D-manno-octulosonic-acid transferase
MRTLYALLWWLALPWLPLRLWWRGRREPGYRKHIGERFGSYPDDPAPRGAIWVHAVSAGETRAAEPLIARIEREQPGVPILLTAMTATGRETGQQLYGSRVHRAFLPYDLPFAVDRFLTRFAPRAGLLMETELWPNLVTRSFARGVPVYLVNARLSQRSAEGYARMGSFARGAFGALAGVAAQSDADAQRLRALGASDVDVTGNIKFDVDVPETQQALGRILRTRFGAGRRVFIAAATRDGEEALLLDSLARAPLPQNALTLIVPRHPQRFNAVADLLARRGLAFVRRSSDIDVPSDTRFVLGDSMGEMYAYYSAADIAFVGGSLMPLGGQNMIEPLAVGVPTLFGPYTFNFADAAANAVSAGAALRVDSADDLVAAVRDLLEDPARRASMQAAGQRFLGEHRGAMDRLWSWLGPRIAKAPVWITARNEYS